MSVCVCLCICVSWRSTFNCSNGAYVGWLLPSSSQVGDGRFILQQLHNQQIWFRLLLRTTGIHRFVYLWLSYGWVDDTYIIQTDLKLLYICACCVISVTQVMQTGITMRRMQKPVSTANYCTLTMERGELSSAFLPIITVGYAMCIAHKFIRLLYHFSFGNPYHNEMSILAPLQQCCRYL